MMYYHSYHMIYRQYELLQGDIHLVCWLPKGDLQFGQRVKINDDPFWWKVIGKSDMMKEEDIYEDYSVYDGQTIRKIRIEE